MIRTLFRHKATKPPEDMVKYFIHIPKTAGTSFRKSLEKKYNVISDYSIKQQVTSPIIKELIYDKSDFYEFSLHLKSLRNSVISGHMPAAKYSHLVGLDNCVTILRRPVDRIVSHYKHQVRHNNCTEEFSKFIERKQNINGMSKLISLEELYAIGVVGLTESYQETIRLVNHAWSGKLIESQHNIAPKKIKSSLHDNTDFSVYDAKIQQLNNDDVMLYEHAKLLFENSRVFYSLGVSDRRAFFNFNEKNGQLVGWGRKISNNEALKIYVCINKGERVELTCNVFRAQLKGKGYSREGYVGFRLLNKIKPGDFVELIDKDTGVSLYSRNV